MSAIPDDLDQLLEDVRKTIRDNDLFLKNLVNDTVGSRDEVDVIEEEEEDFEEL